MKKLLALILAAILMIAMVSCGGNETHEKETDEIEENEGVVKNDTPFTFELYTANTVVITGYKGPYDAHKVEIPAEIEEKDVVGIGDQAFYYNNAITEVVIPESVTFIGKGAFAGCTLLTSVVINGTVKTIGDLAFANCTALNSIALPEGLTSIGNDAFYGCVALNISFPSTLTEIGERAFYGCTALEAVETPASLTKIGTQAFYECSALKSVKLNQEITEIGEFAFHKCAEDLTVNAPAGSYAAKYVAENGYATPGK